VIKSECGVIKGSVETFDVELLNKSSAFVVKLEDVTEGRTEELKCET
jgi:hypothetical protein